MFDDEKEIHSLERLVSEAEKRGGGAEAERLRKESAAMNAERLRKSGHDQKTLPDVIPIAALFDEAYGPNLSDDPRSDLHAADIIMGVDVMSQREFIVYGRDLLERIAAGTQATEASMMRIGIDQDADELQRMIALVITIKGSHDYQRHASQ